ncbi:class I SAM-dependent methyltransferase [Gelidibacter japonicus]|uniref:class I SAM-dependent methyltransferase n=1 Tax=Gelidibacter japonicus TaxID=1962232 RepID=UPI003A8D6112
MNPIKYNHTEKMHNPTAAMEILPRVFSLLNTRSVLDVGCANGSWLKASQNMGVKNVFGVDGIELNVEDMLIDEIDFLKHDLTQPLKLNRKFDLVISLEVAEHLPENAAETFVDNLVAHGDVVLFSAAIPGQGGQYHINEQWPEYWHSRFKERGFLGYDILRADLWNNENVFWWYRQNILLFAKEGTPLFSNMKANNTINALVHPQLYNKKVFKPKFQNSRRDVTKELFSGLKCLFLK